MFLNNARVWLSRAHTHGRRCADAHKPVSEVKPPQLEACSVAQVVWDVLHHLDPREAQAYDLQMEIPEHFTIWADRHYVRQVLRNLLANAFKYCPKQTAVVISATLHEPTTQCV